MAITRLTDATKDIAVINAQFRKLDDLSGDMASVLVRVSRLENIPTDAVRLSSTPSQLACGPSNRGAFNYIASPSGVKDSVQVCAKDALDAYTWRTLY